MSGPKPCRFFSQGTCRYGDKCKFSHVVGQHRGHASRSQTKPVQKLPGTANEDDLRQWKRILHQADTMRPNRQAADRFFAMALQLMDGDLGASQETIKALAGENGLAFIRGLIEKFLPAANDRRARLDLWLSQIYPLFALITHERVVDSGVLEQQVATIYNFMQGIGGRRMEALFNFVLTLLRVLPVSAASPEATCQMTVAGLSLAVLAKMMDCNTSNIVNDEFSRILQQFEAVIGQDAQQPAEYSALQTRKWIQYIRLRLETGDALPLPTEPQTAPGTRAEFVLPKNLPGTLSAQGARHDNDDPDITKITILPSQDEILSVRGEYLPTTDSSSFHRPGILGRLDREFRLLREDTVGQLRDEVRVQLKKIQRAGNQAALSRQKNSLRTYTYHEAHPVSTSFNWRNGLNLLVRFRQPAPKSTQRARQDWWMHSKRLQPGALICIISSNGAVLFCVVSDQTVVSAEDKRKHDPAGDDEAQPDRHHSLADDPDFACVQVQIADAKGPSVREALRWFQNVGVYHKRYLVEFPGVLLPSFQHTLEALQRMTANPDVPFIDLIAPTQPPVGAVEVPPPLYATKPGFFFNLQCLTTDGSRLQCSPNEPLDPEVLAAHSDLDPTQALALVDSLSRSVALVQGPPGTGKSFTGEKLVKVLLANKSAAKLGPILCVCYTNHALDQLLEHFLDDGVKQIIRIGSRSKSERLETVNLRAVAKGAERTKSEKSSHWQITEDLKDQVNATSHLLRQLAASQSHQVLLDYLSDNHPVHHKVLSGPQLDKEGFETVHHGRNQVLDQWLASGTTHAVANGSARRIDDLIKADPWLMTSTERHILYDFWLRDIRDPLIKRVVRGYESYQSIKKRRDGIVREVDLRCLQAADVVGVTTTGLAKNIELLRKLRCKVLLCEEAGEVLEAHSLTALLPSIEHAIFIGDNLQLRPQIQNYDLQSTNPRGRQFSLDVSLFERLVDPPRDDDPKLPFSTLETQRRMHPSISQLVRKTLYPSLQDGGHVATYPEITGMRKRLFWLHHNEPEDHALQQDAISTSHTNSFEIDMTIALVQHLVRQGSYAPDDIAVVTPYLGQLQRLRKKMQNMFEISVGDRDQEELEAMELNDADENQHNPPSLSKATKTTLLKSIRLATVDNFQGEEAKVVVISLVRSNDARRCGFLSTPNRINVLLSRAKHGMYLIGNSDTYGHVPMWSQVLGILRDGGNLGSELELQCPRHPQARIAVSRPDHFLQFSPEGGCSISCDRRLDCGHSCTRRCHSQLLHDAVKCLEPCPRQKNGCDHPCPRVCGEACETKCNKRLDNIKLALPCGHRVTSALCWQTQNPAAILCRKKMAKTVPGCEHVVTVACHVDVTTDKYMCVATCGDLQPCGHNCHSQCHACKNRKKGIVVKENHGMCKQLCGRDYTACRHSCKATCHGDGQCPPCDAPCEVQCSHSKCSKLCHEPCAPCAEQRCASSCPHQQCTMPCAAPCDWVPCSLRCEKVLSCGHRCPSLCGEACPSAAFCQLCCSEDIKSVVVDFIMGMEYREIDLDADPCVFPDCGHFVTKSNMDGIMDLKAHYNMSADENPVAVAKTSAPFSMDEVKGCATCRGSLRNIARYGRIVRRAMLDEATKKFILWSNSKYVDLAEELVTIQLQLSKAEKPKANQRSTRPPKLAMATGRLKQLTLVCEWVGTERYRNIIRLWHMISDFKRMLREEEQPFQRVANFVHHAAQQRKTTGEFTFDESVIQVKGQIQAAALGLKCEVVVFTDFMVLRSDLSGSRPHLAVDLKKQLEDCGKLIASAKAANLPRLEVEGHIYYAKFCAFARAFVSPPSNPTTPEDDTSTTVAQRARFTETGTAHIAAAREVVSKFGSAGVLTSDIDAAEMMLREAVFYTPVSEAEMRSVYQAMAGEFLGTGHWYTCANGHPFTVGECGMPMEQARCPECGAAVGGQSHRPAEGVRRAGEIDELARAVEAVRI